MKENEKYIEFEGQTVAAAINKALERLKVPREAIRVRVVCEEKRGLFGMEGAKPAKIRVALIKEEDRKKSQQ